MGINAKTIDNAQDLTKELTTPIKGLSVVVLDVPNRDANADLIKDLAEKMKSL
jgi:2-succinyl-5-enolpyruvyl-6-hydroxy-3-cyclohexene-1-carboxylate synthase